MGSFDRIVFHGKSAERLCCAEGHSQVRLEFQTKDLDCGFHGYHVMDDRLFQLLGHESLEFGITADGRFERVSTCYGDQSKLTDCAVVYRSCKQCIPVVAASSWGTQGHEPWIEYRCLFREGTLVDVTVEKLESRDDVRRKLIENGTHVFDDDDYMAKQFFEERQLT